MGDTRTSALVASNGWPLAEAAGRRVLQESNFGFLYSPLRRRMSELVVQGRVDLGHGDGLHGRDIHVLSITLTVAHVDGQHSGAEGTHASGVEGGIATDFE